MRRQLPLWALAGSLVASSAALAQTPCNSPIGPDVVVGDMQDVVYLGVVGTTRAFSFGTISCNMGNQNVRWISSNREHPVIGQNMYRIKNGRLEQLGQSFLKHGFTALTGNVCCTCSGVGGSQLGVGCSDPYTATRNGSQGNCGPKYAVNANTGFYPYPFTTSNASLGYTAPPAAPATIGRRLQVADADIDPAQNSGAVYFVETQYVTRDDAFAGNGLNNASYRRINPTSLTAISFVGSTVRQKTAVEGWKDIDPSVTISKVDYPETNTVPIPLSGEPATQVHTARFIAAGKVTDLGGGNYQYSYAIFNANSHRSALAFQIPSACGTNVSSLFFRDVNYHSGEPHNNTDWVPTTTGGKVKWTGTETFAQNQYGNALRWGTTYSFSFVANAAPTTGTGVLTLFRPGVAGDPDTLNVNNIPVPSTPCKAEKDGVAGLSPADIAAFVNVWFDSLTNSNLNGDFDCDGQVVPADLAQYVTVWSNALNGIGC